MLRRHFCRADLAGPKPGHGGRRLVDSDDDPGSFDRRLAGERAQTENPRVGNLTDGTIEAQRREIGKMKTLIGEIELK